MSSALVKARPGEAGYPRPMQPPFPRAQLIQAFHPVSAVQSLFSEQSLTGLLAHPQNRKNAILMVDWPGEGRLTVVPLRPQTQSEPGTSLGTPYCCSGLLPEARTADSIHLLGCHRPVRFFHSSEGQGPRGATGNCGEEAGGKKGSLHCARGGCSPFDFCWNRSVDSSGQCVREITVKDG